MHRIGWFLVLATLVGCSGAATSKGAGGDSCSSNGDCASNVCKGATTASSSSGAPHGDGVAPSTEGAPHLAPLGTCSAPMESAPASGSGGAGCDGHGEGEYRCSGAYGIEVCHGGAWEHETTCSCSVSVGDPRKPPYPTSCSPLSTGSVACEYAGEACLACSKGRSCVSLK